MGSLPDPTPVGAGQPARGDDEVVTEGRGVQEEGQGCTEGVGEEHGSTAAVGERKASGGAAPRDEEGSTQRGRVVHLVLWGAIDPETDETAQQGVSLLRACQSSQLPVSCMGRNTVSYAENWAQPSFLAMTCHDLKDTMLWTWPHHVQGLHAGIGVERYSSHFP
eukprot:1158920-Pelagomonas_calceolata.AAC.4